MKKLHRVLLATGTLSLAAAMAQASPGVLQLAQSSSGAAATTPSTDMGAANNPSSPNDAMGTDRYGNSGSVGGPNDMGASRDRNSNPDLSGFAGCPSGDTECIRNRRNSSDTDNRMGPNDSGTWDSNRGTDSGSYGGGTIAPDTSGTRRP